MSKHEANKFGKPNERFIWWMKNAPYFDRARGGDLSSARLAKNIGLSRGYIDLIRQGRKPISEQFAKKIAEYDKKMRVKTGDDPAAAIRWQYLMGKDNWLTETNYQSDPVIKDLKEEADEIWLQVRTEELVRWFFQEAGFTLKKVGDSFYDITPKENYKTRRITQEAVDDAIGVVKDMAYLMAKWLYDTANGKELTIDAINTEANN